MIKGTIMEIGKEDSTGLVDILIQTTRDEIKRVTINPIYRLVEISLPCENDNFKGYYMGEKIITFTENRTKKTLLFLLNKRIDELELSRHSEQCLRAANIHTVADLVRNKADDMLKYKNFDRKSLIEIGQVLNIFGLWFGMDVDSIINKPEVKSSHGKFPSLVECEEIVRKSMSRENLTHHHFTDQDKHIIGTLWAYLERVYNET